VGGRVAADVLRGARGGAAGDGWRGNYGTTWPAPACTAPAYLEGRRQSLGG